MVFTDFQHNNYCNYLFKFSLLPTEYLELESKLAVATEQNGVTLIDELHNDMKKMAASFTQQVYKEVLHLYTSVP